MKSIVAALVLGSVLSAPALAADCGTLNALLSARKATIAKIQGWKQVHTDVVTACFTFTDLEKDTRTTLDLVTQMGAACKVPKELTPVLNKDLPAIIKAKEQTCNNSTGHYQNSLVR